LSEFISVSSNRPRLLFFVYCMSIMMIHYDESLLRHIGLSDTYTLFRINTNEHIYLRI